MNKLLVALMAGCFALTAYAAEGDLKIGFIDGQRVIAESPQAAKAKKKLEKEFEKRDQDLQRMSKQLQSLQESLDKNGPTMSESDHRAKEREFNDLNREFQRRQREFREDLNVRQNEETAALFERVNRAVKQVAEAEKFDLILQEAAYVNPRIDVTEKVIKALGDGSKDAAPAAAK